MAAHALHFPTAAPHLKLVVSRPAAVWPAAPPLVVQEPAMSDTMKRCLLLAVLLHVWLVLMLGNAPGGTAAPGQGVAGTLNITLQGPETPGATEAVAPPLPAPPEGTPGSATLPRWGGVVREQAMAAPATPGAVQLGRWAATPQPVQAVEVPPAPPGRVVEERALPEPTAVLRAMPPALQPGAPSAPSAPSDLAAQPALRALQALAPEPAAQAVPALTVPALTVPMEAPAVLPAPLPERRLAAPAARTAPEAGAALPFAPTAPAAPAVLPDAAALPLPHTVTPRLQAPVRRVAADVPALAAAATAAVPLPSVQAPVALPDIAPLPLAPQAPAPASAGPEVPAAPARATPSALQPSALQPSARTPQPAQVPSPAVTPGQAPASTRTPELPAAAFKPGAPDAGSRLGTDVATPPSAAASALPRLNLQLSRPRGGELSRGGSAGVLPVLPRPPDIDEKLGRDIARSARQDCKDAYRGAGLMAVVPLAVQALKADSGCRW